MRAARLFLLGPVLVASSFAAFAPAPPAIASPASAVTSDPAAERGIRFEVNYGRESRFPTVLEGPTAQGTYPRGPGFGSGGYDRPDNQFVVQDTRPEGSRVAVHWRLANYSRRGLCINEHGNGEIALCDKEFSATRTLLFRIGVCSGGSDARCNEVDEYRYWSGWVRKPAG